LDPVIFGIFTFNNNNNNNEKKKKKKKKKIFLSLLAFIHERLIWVVFVRGEGRSGAAYTPG